MMDKKFIERKSLPYNVLAFYISSSEPEITVSVHGTLPLLKTIENEQGR
jgi:hypothetical protein